MATLVTSINQFVRIPGQKPMKFSQSMDLPKATVIENGERAWLASYPEAQHGIPITEAVYEQVLYARAVQRFQNFIENQGRRG